MVIRLLKYGSDNDHRVSLSTEPILLAGAMGGDIELFKMILRARRNRLSAGGVFRSAIWIRNISRALSFAAHRGHLEIVQLLLEAGATKLNKALQMAAEAGHEKIIDLLVARGDLNLGWGLAGAASGGHLAIVHQMIERGATRTPESLISAIMGKNHEIINLILDGGVGNLAIVELLIARGTSLTADDFNTALGEAASDGSRFFIPDIDHLNLVALLLESATVFDQAVIKAVSGGNIDIVRRILEHTQRIGFEFAPETFVEATNRAFDEDGNRRTDIVELLESYRRE